jgi:Calcineurin-like phosphoesterase
VIAQVLNRDFVLEQLDFVQFELQRPPGPRRREEDLPAQPAASDMAAAADELRQAKEREQTSSGQAGYVDPEARRGEEPAPLDDFVFISRDPVIGILQSALQEYFETEGAHLVESEPPPDDSRRAADDRPAITDATLRDCLPTRVADDGRRVFNAFSQTDPRWVASKVAEGIRLFRGWHAFEDKPANPFAIADNARLILVGDWGSGLPRARAVAKRMRKEMESAVQQGRQVHVIHLGDVYYSGWKKEYERNFLKDWPVNPNEAETISSWSLNGNHDMFSGGHAYFNFLLADPRFHRQQRSSFFSLHNRHWDIIGLDTAWEDAGLAKSQAAWLEGQFLKSPRKSMFLSHHQLFSAYEHGSPKLKNKLDKFLTIRGVDAWFWGHEHRCVFYGPSEGVRQARLIGNGGVPVYMFHRDTTPYPSPAFYEYREFFDAGLERWAYFGFAVVDLDGATAHVRYVDEFGREFKKEELT